jgi:hypothetical protein
MTKEKALSILLAALALLLVLVVWLTLRWSQPNPIVVAEMWLLIGPGFSCLFTAQYCLKFILPQNGGAACTTAALCSAILIVVSFLLNFGQSFVHHWIFHLALLSFLFLAFVIWDVVIVDKSNVGEELKNEVRNGNRLINVPTLFALFLTLMFLLLASYFDIDISAWTGENKPFVMITRDGTTLDASSKIVTSFVAGLASFHLILATMSYLVVSRRVDSLVRYLTPSGKV